MKHSAVILYAILIITFLYCSCSREEFGGLGIEVPSGPHVVTEENPYRIVSVFEGGTGHGAGLKDGDIILAIDGKKLANRRQDTIVTNLLRGRVGSIVLLEVKRGDEVLSYAIQRGKVVLSNE